MLSILPSDDQVGDEIALEGSGSVQFPINSENSNVSPFSDFLIPSFHASNSNC